LKLKFRPVVIELYNDSFSCKQEVEAWSIPGTEESLVVNAYRGCEGWAVTHFQTGIALLGLFTQEDAVAKGKELFDLIADKDAFQCATEGQELVAVVSADVRDWMKRTNLPFYNHHGIGKREC